MISYERYVIHMTNKSKKISGFVTEDSNYFGNIPEDIFIISDQSLDEDCMLILSFNSKEDAETAVVNLDRLAAMTQDNIQFDIEIFVFPVGEENGI